MERLSYITPSGIQVERTASKIPYEKGLRSLLEQLETQRGIYFSSGYEYPGRHARWDIAGVNPSLEIVSEGRQMELRALNARGQALNQMLAPLLAPHPHWESLDCTPNAIKGCLNPLPTLFPEEERSKQPSAFSILRTILNEFQHPLGSKLALVGAFGYDLLLQFDPIQLRMPRQGLHDLRLFFCDELYFMDRKKEQIERYRYDFTLGEATTRGLKRTGTRLKPNKSIAQGPVTSDHTPEEYMAKVETVREGMRRGDYYEVVLCQMFRAQFSGSVPQLFERVQKSSPSPYEYLLQFGEEQLIGASPEIFVRVEGKHIESSPIAGTTRRTGDPMKDAENIRALLASTKEESELTMCTDVDRNDKSRVCQPGSVRVLGRRLIERFAGVYHTVDHVEGMLAEGFDALDAFLTHMWSVTIIGAPKKWAAQAIEDLEKEPRGWYTGAVGMLSFDGNMNTGITIRTIHLRDGVARYGAGATLLYDSIPENEDRECHMKATNFFRALESQPRPIQPYRPSQESGRGLKLLLVDNEDCFIHTLSNYARQTGAEVITYRAGFPLHVIDQLEPSLLVISPGPGRPSDFGVPDLVRHATKLGVPIFGVCLGLQGIVEAFGGELGLLDYPMHGKPSLVRHWGAGIFEGMPPEFTVGRYHSLHALRETLPACLEVTAETPDGIIMGVRHVDLPIEAVQFHPESILSLEDGCGLRLMENAVLSLGRMRVRTGAHRT